MGKATIENTGNGIYNELKLASDNATERYITACGLAGIKIKALKSGKLAIVNKDVNDNKAILKVVRQALKDDNAWPKADGKLVGRISSMPADFQRYWKGLINWTAFHFGVSNPVDVTAEKLLKEIQARFRKLNSLFPESVPEAVQWVNAGDYDPAE